MPTLWMSYFGSCRDVPNKIGWQCYAMEVSHDPPTLTNEEQNKVKEFVDKIDPEHKLQWQFTGRYLGPN